MTLHKLHAGDGYTYLTRQVASADETRSAGQRLADYYTATGTPPGRWIGAGSADLGISGVVREEQMKALFGRGLHPDADRIIALETAAGTDPVEVACSVKLGRAFPTYGRLRPRTDRVAVMARRFATEHGRTPTPAEMSRIEMQEARKERKAVAGYDLVFSPVKSASVLWALGDAATRQAIEDAHHEAVANTIAWLEQNTCFARLGEGGHEQVDARGFLATAFDHFESRAGDPDLHTHVAIANKVRTVADDDDGRPRWRALDARVLHAAAVAASERYNTRLEDGIARRLGVTFIDRPDTLRADKRPVREIAQVTPTLIERFSQRRQAITDRTNDLRAEYLERHSVLPGLPAELALAQRATLETRAAKAAARPLAELLAGWRQQARQTAGPRVVNDLHAAIEGALSTTPTEVLEVDDVAHEITFALSRQKATWTRWTVHAETERFLRPARFSTAADRAAFTAAVAARSLEPAHSVQLTPALIGDTPIRSRADGESLEHVHGSERYSHQDVLDAEQRLLDATDEHTTTTVSTAGVDLAIATHEHAHGIELEPEQRDLVHAFATTPHRLVVGVGPAGTGKTTAMAALTRAWTGPCRRVVPLAPSATAAHLLGTELGIRAENLTKFQHAVTHQSPDDWYRLRAGDLVLVDEASMVDTHQLDWLVQHARSHDAAVRLLGDPAQLDAVGVGGAFDLLCRAQPATRLATLRRFDDPAEAAATLQLRDGDTNGLDYYYDHHRITTSEPAQTEDRAIALWAAQIGEGHETVLLAASAARVAALNRRAQTELARGGQGFGAALGDGNTAQVCDRIITRQNVTLTHSDGTRTPIRNGDRWCVRLAHRNGDLTVDDGRRRARLPAGYLSQHAQLGYASTIASAQGLTVDSTVLVADSSLTREALYVAVTRARSSTQLVVETDRDQSDREVLEAALQGFGRKTSASITARRDFIRPTSALRATAERRAGVSRSLT